MSLSLSPKVPYILSHVYTYLPNATLVLEFYGNAILIPANYSMPHEWFLTMSQAAKLG